MSKQCSLSMYRSRLSKAKTYCKKNKFHTKNRAALKSAGLLATAIFATIVKPALSRSENEEESIFFVIKITWILCVYFMQSLCVLCKL